MARKNLKWVLAETEYETLVLAQPEVISKAYGPKEFLTLRPCAQGKDEYDCVVKTLYCTRDGRFFVRKKDGWHEQKYNFTPNSPSLKDGRCHSRYPQMRNFDALHCHTLIAHAWIGERPEGEQIDHINGDLLNWSADNLRYVTPHENMRSARNMRCLRRMGIDPKWLHRNTLLYIYELNLKALKYFAAEYRLICENNDAEMTIENIEKVVMMAYLNTRRYFFTMKLPSLDVRYQYHYLPALDYKVTEMKGYYNRIEDFNL
jgi:hypothetical protein